MQIHAIFSGNVQQVGFRYFTKDLADKLNLAGYVKNLPDGTIELVAEGEKEDLEQLVKTLKSNFDIRKDKIKWLTSTNQSTGFKIIF